MSSRGFGLAWKSVVFRVFFRAVFARSLLIQQRRGNGRRLVHKILRAISIDESSSLWKNFVRSFKYNPPGPVVRGAMSA